MSAADQLIETFQDIGSTYIKKDIRQYIITNLENIKKHVDNQKIKCLDEVIAIITKERPNIADRKRLSQLEPTVIKIINENKQQFAQNDNLTNETITLDEIESMLDKKIPNYNIFTENHPMKGITWDKSKQKFQVKNENINTCSKDLDTACQKIIQSFDVKNTNDFGIKYVIKFFVYHNQYFITYWTNNEPFFDIQHIISVLTLKKSSWNDKYNEYHKHIIHFKLHKNEFGGYILRELISEESMTNLIMSSNSTFSKSFKKDISRILSEMRRNGLLSITNESIKLVLPRTKKSLQEMDEENNKLIAPDTYPIYNYNDPLDAQFIRHLITIGANTALSKFHNKHILYAFIIPLKTDHQDIIIKFGYSESLIKRDGTLKKEYKSNMYFITAKIINGQRDERTFHDHLKNKFPTLIESHIIDGKEKTELYKFSPILLREFDEYLHQDDTNPELIQCINLEMVRHYKKHMTESMYDYMIIKEINQHEEVMAQKNLELSQLRYQYIDKEIQLAKIRSTLAETTSTNTSNTIESSKFNTSYRTKILSKIPHYNSPSMPTTKNVTLANLIKINEYLKLEEVPNKEDL